MCTHHFTKGWLGLIRWNLELLEQVKHIAEEAGLSILEIYQQEEVGIKTKRDQSPLTQADLASNVIIMKALKKLTPDIPILSEEGHMLDEKVDTFWCVDPLDGTKEFIKKNDEFTVNIALIEQNQPILGVIHIPVMNQTFMSLKGKGAFKVHNNKTQKLIKQTVEIHSPPIFAVSRSHLNKKTKTFIDLHLATTMPAGSSLKLTLLAEGEVDAYPRFGPTSLWDMAAGHAILREIGGEIYTSEQQPLIYNVKQIINPDLVAVKHKNIKFTMKGKQ